MKNKKGFTLIELLAVIVILAVIALIATPVVMNSIEEARRGSARNAAFGFVKAVEHEISLNILSNPGYQVHIDGEEDDDVEENPGTFTGFYWVSEPNDLQGTAPTEIRLEVEDNEIIGGGLCINGYSLEYQSNGDFQLTDDPTDYCDL